MQWKLARSRQEGLPYIRLYRITQASKLLRETGLSVEDIATECGFASASYFISAFKKCLKTTPLRYRNGA